MGGGGATRKEGGAKMSKKTNKKMNVEISWGLWVHTMGAVPYQTQGETKRFLHTSHFSILYTELRSVSCQGPLTYFSYDFKNNSAYQQGVLPHSPEANETAARLSQGAHEGLLPSPPHPWPFIWKEWLVILFYPILSWMGLSVHEGSCGAPRWKRVLHSKRKTLFPQL